MKGALSIWGRNRTGSNHRSLFLFLVMLPAIFCLAGPLWADAWEPVVPSGPVPGARSGHSMVLIGGKVYLFGGEGNSGGNGGERATKGMLFNDMWSYVSESNEWVEIVPNNTPPKARKNHAAVSYGEKMFIFFGEGGQGPLGDIWAYDVASNVWQEVITTGQVTPPAVSGQSVVVNAGKAYMFGGQDRYGNVYSDLWSLDLGSFIWELLEGFNLPSEGQKAVANDTTMYVYGGDNGQQVYDHLWSYDFATKQWKKLSPKANIPTGRTCPIAGLDANKITIQGGQGQTSELGDTWEFDIVSEQWVRKADGPVLSSSAAVVVNAGSSSPSKNSASVKAASHILMFGGEKGGQFLNEMWKYTASSNAPQSTPAINLLVLD